MAEPRWVEPVVLEGELARLEPMAADHLPGLVEAGADPDIWTWMPRSGDTPDAMRDIVDAAIDSTTAGRELAFVTIDRATGQVAGSTRYLSIAPEHRRLEIGWTWLGEPWRGTGLNSEVKLLQLEHAFVGLGARRVEFKTDARNERSRAALLAIGATYEGTFRKHMIVRDGQRRDSAYYSIIDEEWPEVRERLLERILRRMASRRSASDLGE